MLNMLLLFRPASTTLARQRSLIHLSLLQPWLPVACLFQWPGVPAVFQWSQVTTSLINMALTRTLPLAPHNERQQHMYHWSNLMRQ
jgi:hypothetical protein